MFGNRVLLFFLPRLLLRLFLFLIVVGVDRVHVAALEDHHDGEDAESDDRGNADEDADDQRKVHRFFFDRFICLAAVGRRVGGRCAFVLLLRRRGCLIFHDELMEEKAGFVFADYVSPALLTKVMKVVYFLFGWAIKMFKK